MLQQEGGSFKYNGGWYKIKTGPKGGKYILVNGVKKYMPR